MKVTLASARLKAAIEIARKSVPSRPTHPALSTVKLEATESTFRLIGFDLAKACTVEISRDQETLKDEILEIESPGAACVSAKLFADYVNKLGSCDVTLELVDLDESGEDVEQGDVSQGYLDMALKSRILVLSTSFGGELELSVLDPSEYPEIPAPSDSAVWRSIDWSRVMEVAFKSASEDQSKQSLCSINIAFDEDADDGWKAGATDGHRLAVVSSSTDLIPPGNKWTTLRNFNLPTEACSVLPKEELKFFFEGELAHFCHACGSMSVSISSRINGSLFPNYEQLIPATFTHEQSFNRRELAFALSRANVIAQEGNGIVDVVFSKGVGITVNASSPIGVTSEVVVEEVLADFAFSANAKYLMEALASINSDIIVLGFNSPTSPILLWPGNKLVRYLVMPVQKRRDEEAPSRGRAKRKAKVKEEVKEMAGVG